MVIALDKAEIDAIIAALAPADPAVIYLFGSMAQGSAGSQSDVDLAIVPRREMRPLSLFRIKEEIEVRLGRDTDLISLPTASEALKIRVIQTGIPLRVASPVDKDNFEMIAFSDYTRLNEERRPILESMRLTGSFYEL